MNFFDWILVGIIVVLVLWAVAVIRKKKQSGGCAGCSGCGGGCSSCPSAAAPQEESDNQK